MARNGVNGFEGAGELSFATGSVTGIRAWSLNLRGLQVAKLPFTDVSAAHSQWRERALLRGSFGWSWPGASVEATCKWSPLSLETGELSRTEHRVPEAACACGFWAYWDRGAVPANTTVTGVIEGFGKTLIGTRGFRSQRARLLGLCLTGEDPLARAVVFKSVPVDASESATSAPPESPESSESLEETARRERAVLARLLTLTYSVPVYESVEKMLARHPLTTDYVPEHDERNPECECPPCAAPVPLRLPKLPQLQRPQRQRRQLHEPYQLSDGACACDRAHSQLLLRSAAGAS
jgi:hypothetical protein